MSNTCNYNCFPLNPYLSINTPKKTALQFVYFKIFIEFSTLWNLKLSQKIFYFQMNAIGVFSLLTINNKSFWICTLYFLACIFLGKSRISHKFWVETNFVFFYVFPWLIIYSRREVLVMSFVSLIGLKCFYFK